VPADLVKVIIHGTLTFILKVQHAPDLSTVCDALSILQTETKATSESTAQILDALKNELKVEIKTTTEIIHTIGTNVQQNIGTVEQGSSGSRQGQSGEDDADQEHRITDRRCDQLRCYGS
jgi:hypothetical protein